MLRYRIAKRKMIGKVENEKRGGRSTMNWSKDIEKSHLTRRRRVTAMYRVLYRLPGYVDI